MLYAKTRQIDGNLKQHMYKTCGVDGQFSISFTYIMFMQNKGKSDDARACDAHKQSEKKNLYSGGNMHENTHQWE